MKIAIISNYTLGAETGSAKVSETLCKYLSKRNEVVYICLGEKYELVKVSKDLIYLKIPSVAVKTGFIAKLTPSVASNLLKDLDLLKPDIIHAQNIVFATLITLLWAKKNNVPFIITFHAMPSEGMSYVFPKLANDRVVNTIDFQLTSRYIKAFLDNTDLTIALNKSVRKSIKKIKTNAKISIINNPIDLNYFSKRSHTPGEKIKFIFLGSYIERKNQIYLIKVFSLLPNNYELNLYGNIKTGKDYVNKLRKLIREKNIRNVFINDFLKGSEVWVKLNSSDYFISASTKEVQSLVVIEALASGIPVIGLENETINELINKKNGLKVGAKTTPTVFAKKLISFINNSKNKYEELSTNARKSVERFDPIKVTEKIEKLYKKEIHNKKRSIIKKDTFKILVPSEVRNILPEYIGESIEVEKPNKIKFYLSLTVIFSLVAAFIFGIIKLLKKVNVVKKV